MNDDIMNISNSMIYEKPQDKRKEWTNKKSNEPISNDKIKKPNKILFFIQLEKNIIWINNDLNYPKDKNLWYIQLNSDVNCCYGPFSSESLIFNIKRILNIPENYTRYEFTGYSFIGIRPIDIFKFNTCHDFEFIDITDLGDKKTLLKLVRSNCIDYIKNSNLNDNIKETLMKDENKIINNIEIINDVSISMIDKKELNETINDTIINSTFIKNDILSKGNKIGNIPTNNAKQSNKKNKKPIYSSTKGIIKDFYKKDDNDTDSNNSNFEEEDNNIKDSYINENSDKIKPYENIIDEQDWLIIGSKSSKAKNTKNSALVSKKQPEQINIKHEEKNENKNKKNQINKVDVNIINELNPKNKKIEQKNILKDEDKDIENEVKLGFEYVGEQTFIQSNIPKISEVIKDKRDDNDDFVIINKKKKK